MPPLCQLLTSSLILLCPENIVCLILTLEKIIVCFMPEYGLPWWKIHTQFERMCIILLLCWVFYKCIFYKCQSVGSFFQIVNTLTNFLLVLSIDTENLKFSTKIMNVTIFSFISNRLCFIYFEGLLSGKHTFRIIMAS